MTAEQALLAVWVMLALGSLASGLWRVWDARYSRDALIRYRSATLAHDTGVERILMRRIFTARMGGIMKLLLLGYALVRIDTISGSPTFITRTEHWWEVAFFASALFWMTLWHIMSRHYD